MKINLTAFFVLFFLSTCINAEPIVVKHYQKQQRYKFGILLLELALSKIGPFEIVEYEYDANEARGEHLVISGDLDIEFLQTTKDREKMMIPIKIPIYRGLLGLRMLLVNKDNYDKMQSVKTLQDLRSYVGGHGKHWIDLSIYAANGLKTETNAQYESIFHQLAANRFDYFHRGINEIWAEEKRHSKKLKILDSLMLFYQHPVYFFVTKKRPKLAKQIEQGLIIAKQDGSFKNLFLTSFKDIIAKAKFQSKELIILKNPDLPENSPLIDTSWWLPENFRKLVRREYKQQKKLNKKHLKPNKLPL